MIRTTSMALFCTGILFLGSSGSSITSSFSILSQFQIPS